MTGEPAFLAGAVAAVLIGTSCACLGVYVVLRRMAFVGDALAHTVLPGLVVALLLGYSTFLGALVAGLATALGIGWLTRRQALREDTAIGVLFTAMFALGVVLAADRDPHELNALLFGDLGNVGRGELVLLGAVTVVVLTALALLHKELELTSFDPGYAEAVGIRTDRLRYLLLALIALAVVSAVRAVGVLLTAALLVTPAAAASMLTASLPRMMALGTGLAVASAIAGLWLSLRFALPSGAAIVLVCTASFAIAWTVHTVRLGRG